MSKASGFFVNSALWAFVQSFVRFVVKFHAKEQSKQRAQILLLFLGSWFFFSYFFFGIFDFSNSLASCNWSLSANTSLGNKKKLRGLKYR